eukprot:scaffold230984_cov31-Tisochrysis_lutea.AAC.2
MAADEQQQPAPKPAGAAAGQLARTSCESTQCDWSRARGYKAIELPWSLQDAHRSPRHRCRLVVTAPFRLPFPLRSLTSEWARAPL